MSFLLDTNVVSESSRKRPDPRVLHWVEQQPSAAKFVSVLTIGEIRNSIERLRRHDRLRAGRLERWFDDVVAAFEDRVLGVDRAISDYWGRLGVPDPLPPVDGLIAATAQVRGLTVASRNLQHFERCGVPVVNPFTTGP